MEVQTQIEKKVSPVKTVEALRARALSNPVFNAICSVFAIRERTRQQITLQSLMATMLKEKFKYTREQYIEELKFLASLGIGQLARDSKNRVTALKNIKITLQSIGLSGLSEKDTLKTVTFATHFTKLPDIQESQPKPEPKPVVQAPIPPKPKTPDYKATLTIQHEGKTLVFDLAKTASAKDLLAYVSELYANRR